MRHRGHRTSFPSWGRSPPANHRQPVDLIDTLTSILAGADTSSRPLPGVGHGRWKFRRNVPPSSSEGPVRGPAGHGPGFDIRQRRRRIARRRRKLKLLGRVRARWRHGYRSPPADRFDRRGLQLPRPQSAIDRLYPEGQRRRRTRSTWCR